MEAEAVARVEANSMEAGDEDGPLLSGGAGPQSACRPRLAVAAALLVALAIAGWSAAQGGGAGGRVAPDTPRLEGAVGLEIEHGSDFGLVPDALTVAGASCNVGDDVGLMLNNVFRFQGVTPEGRAWYFNDWTGNATEPGTGLALYYGTSCNRTGEMTNWWHEMMNSWHFVIRSFDPVLRAVECPVLYAGTASIYAYLVMEEGAPEKPGVLGAAPGAIPPTGQKWRVLCNDEWTVQKLEITGGSVAAPHAAKVEGAWEFRFTAMPKQTVTLKHGKQKTTTEGNAWNVNGKGTIEIDVGAGLPKVLTPLFDAHADVKASAELGGGFERTWATEGSRTEEEEVSFELPEEKGSALFQWVLTMNTPTGDSGRVVDRNFAFTPSRAHRPRCYPGGSLDHYSYQECIPGWEIPGA